MKMRLKVLVPLVLLLLAVTWLFWPRGGNAPSPVKAPAVPAAVVASALPVAGTNAAPDSNPDVITRSAASTNREAFRLSNTARTIGQLTEAPHAILLENALVDTDAKVSLNIPKHLKASAEPGAYIVQARGPVTAAFRAVLDGAGAQIVSYIPNNAYLVQLSGAGAGLLSANPQVQAVLPYEPYFKVQSSLLGRAVEQKPLVPGTILTLGLFSSGAESTVKQIQKLGGSVVGTEVSPFGPVVRVLPLSADWLALAQLPGVMRVEPATRRQLANDLSRVTMAITTDVYATNENWLNLYGSNVLVQVNDTGIDATQPDLTGRVFGFSANSLTDTNGHGTHIAGIIAGSGVSSPGVSAAGSVTNADFRGKAPLAKLYSFGIFGSETNVNITEALMQAVPALTNALISNNSWSYGVNEYDLSAASFDAAVRDSLPTNTGPQAVLYVFPAGNDGGGRNDGFGGSADTIVSPGTAKNVLTVGALDQYRYITNEVVLLDGSTNKVWLGQTDSSSELAFFSGRGNVGVQTEGTFGRFKPDVVAPGAFVLSTLSQQMDLEAYYNPTNYHTEYSLINQTVFPGTVAYGGAPVPINAVGVTIRVKANANSAIPFPTNFPIYFSASGVPGPTNANDIVTSNNVLSIPPGAGSLTSIDPLRGGGFAVAVGDPTNVPVNFDLIIQIITTNDNGNALTVLSNINETVAPYYMYRSGTSMAAAAASGSLALLQEFLQSGRNPSLPTNPSPALLKAMLINGSRLTAGYNNFATTNFINYEGWGLVNVPNSVPLGLTNNTAAGNPTAMFIQDQSPTNVLASGDRHTYNISVPTEEAQNQFLRITLAWTDPPGNPAAAIKLVNNLDLVVTNLATGEIYYGNHFIPGTPPYTAVAGSNDVADAINNIENIWIPDPLGTNYSVTVIGRNVAVNAVTLNQTNIVQDYALIISCGDSQNTNGVVVTRATPTAPTAVNPTITFISSYTNGIYFNQLAGANAPWLSTNNVAFAGASAYGTNAALFIGQTNQWHFFVVTNTTSYTNAAFIIFLPQTQATPRMGVFEYTEENSTRPEADLNLFVASAPDASAGLITNLDQTVISNCVFNVNGDQSSLARGGTKFLVYSNSVQGQVYYVGVQCQDQMAAQFGFLSVFSQNPFSQLNPDGSQTVNGLLVPVAIPDGNNVKAGVGYCVALALYPMEVGDVIVTNTITHENYGDLVEILGHGSTFSVLNNKNGVNDGVVNLTTVYNDSGLPGTVHSSGPGSLDNFVTKEGSGPWILTVVDDAETASGYIENFTLNIKPNPDLNDGVVVTIGPQQWFYGYLDVPVGYTNLLIAATNLPPTSTPPIEMYLNFDERPGFSNFLVRADLTNGAPWPGNTISYGPPLVPGTYWVGLYNPDFVSHDVYIKATLFYDASAISRVDFASTGVLPLLDDAVSYSYQFVDSTDTIQDMTVGLRVDHERISDLVFTLISPDGTRYLLMENRGGQSTNGCGATVVVTNTVNVPASGGPEAQTNYINVGTVSGTLPITYNFYTVPDQMTVYYGTNAANFSTNSPYLILDTGMVSGSNSITLTYPPVAVTADSTYVTVIMNQFGSSSPTTAWDYTAGGVLTNYYYLSFTENTNRTTTPIKYAVPPFTPKAVTNFVAYTNFPGYTQWPVASGGNDHWYKAVVNVASDPLNWNQADQIARNAGGHLATITSQAENDFVFTNLINNGSYFSGVGNNGSGPAIGGIWTNPPTLTAWGWETGEPWTYDNWFSGQPDFANETRAHYFSGIQGVPANTWNNLAPTDNNLGGYVIEIEPYTNTVIAAGDLYYLPEDDFSGLQGTDPYGWWTLEILDNRAGATNNANLLSWNLNFTFANTNVPTTISTNFGGTNYIAGGATQWFLVNVPTNVDWATNSLLFATLPLQLWWSTNSSPAITNIDNVRLLTNSTGGSAVIGTNTSPAFLIPGGTYYLGVQNTNVAGAFYALDVFFHYLAVTPTVITLPATDLDLSSATLQAAVHPGYTTATVYFEYGTTTNLGTNSLTFTITNNFNFFNLVSIGVTNLAPETTYYFRAVATNSVGTNYGNILTFFTTPFPRAQTLPATLVNGASAQLNGFATPNASSLPTTAWFEWGTNRAYGNLTPPVSVGTGFSVVYTNAQITGLLTNVAYHFRLVVSNAQSVVYGFDQVLDQANVVAWGANFQGQINVPLGLSNVVAVAGAYDHSLALKIDGTAVAWGDNSAGQSTVPAGLNNLVAVAGGEYFSLALKANGTVTAWGANLFPNQTNVPVGLNNVVSIAAGRFVSLALKADGTVTNWGAAFFGLNAVPAGLTNVVAVAGGSLHNLALLNNGTVTGWGDDTYGQTNVPAGLKNVVAIAAGAFHNLALKSDGTVVAWGYNSSGQTNVPAGLTNVVAISAGGFHSVALRQDGSIVAWGDYSAGQTLVPVGLTNAVAISSGNLHNLALTPQAFTSLTNAFVFNLTNGLPVTNNILPGAVTYYQVDVPTNADFATNTLFYSNGGLLNVWFVTNTPPTLVGAKFLFSGATNGVAVSSVLSTTSAPTNIVPGGTYYLGVQNTNTVTVNYAIGVDFHLVNTNPPPVFTNAISIASIIYTNIGSSNGFLLTWFAPSNYLFQVQWIDSLSSTNWNTFTNPTFVSFNTNYPASATNAQFNFFDDGSQTGGFGPMRFYRLLVYPGAGNTAPVFNLGPTATRYVTPTYTLIVTNTATDAEAPPQTLTYSLLSAPVGVTLTNGVIYWTPSVALAGTTNLITTVVTDNGTPALSATNVITVLVNPLASISSVTFGTNGTTLQWTGWTNEQFQVQWTTNLAPPSWTIFPGTITSTNGTFTFVDTNTTLLMKFYQLILLP